MLRVRCPECGIETEIRPTAGYEVVAAYCLKHRGGAEQHLRPVYMTPILTEGAPLRPEPVAA